jgi:hypothetical protein
MLYLNFNTPLFSTRISESYLAHEIASQYVALSDLANTITVEEILLLNISHKLCEIQI